jgi:hypothetical protein
MAGSFNLHTLNHHISFLSIWLNSLYLFSFVLKLLKPTKKCSFTFNFLLLDLCFLKAIIRFIIDVSYIYLFLFDLYILHILFPDDTLINNEISLDLL